MKKCALMLSVVLLLMLALGVAKAQDVAKTPYVSWSPDGTMLAVGSGTSIQIIDAGSLKVLNTLSGLNGQTTEAAWSADGTRLAAQSKEGIEIWQSPGNSLSATLILSIPAFTGIINGISWNPDDSELATAAGDFVDLWDTVSGKNIRSLSGDWANIQDLAWSADNRIALASLDSTVSIIDPVTGKPLTNFYASHLETVPAVTAIAFSPDDKRIAISIEGSTALIWGDTRTGEVAPNGELWEDYPQLVLSGEISATDYGFSLSWASTGQLIAGGMTDGTVRIWDATTGDELQKIQVGADTFVNSVAWSPDGMKLAYGKPDGTVEIVPAPSPVTSVTAEATESAPSG